MIDYINLIPSKDYREYFRNNIDNINDIQKVKLIYDLNISIKDKLSIYSDIINELNDEEIKEYISNLIKDETDTNIDNLFADYPILFDNGDIIKYHTSINGKYKYGIIHIFEDRNIYKKRLKLFNLIPDDEVTVEFVDEFGTFYHKHILPIYIEKANCDEIPLQIYALLNIASSLLKGKQTIENLQFVIQSMKIKK